MIDAKVQHFLNHCVNVIKVDTITNKTADGEERWEEVATLGDVVLVAEYSDRDYDSDNFVRIKYVVGHEYVLKVRLTNFLSLDRADIERVGEQAKAFHERYVALHDELTGFLASAKKQMKEMLP